MSKYYIRNVTLKQTGTVALMPLDATMLINECRKMMPNYEFELVKKEATCGADCTEKENEAMIWD